MSLRMAKDSWFQCTQKPVLRRLSTLSSIGPKNSETRAQNLRHILTGGNLTPFPSHRDRMPVEHAECRHAYVCNSTESKNTGSFHISFNSLHLPGRCTEPADRVLQRP